MTDAAARRTTGSCSSLKATGLKPSQTAYTFTVTATNAAGVGQRTAHGDHATNLYRQRDLP